MGRVECQGDLFVGTGFVGERLAPDSIFAVLHRDGGRLFGEALFADLFSWRGRRSVSPRVVATVMVLQRWFGMSDREAVAAFEFDVRWRYACGGLGFDSGGFCHTVLVGMRARLAASRDPGRVFDATLRAARSAGLVGARRVLDSAPVYDAVATQDTVAMLRGALARLLAGAGAVLEPRLRAVLEGGDGYAPGSKAVCDWSDPLAREALVAALGADAAACLGVLDGLVLDEATAQAAQLLAAVMGQDLRQDAEGRFCIARRVARNRIISTVDTDARHGRKSSARGFDGYKGHAAVDPDSEIITATAVTAGNAADGSVAVELIKDLLEHADTADTDTADTDTDDSDSADSDSADSDSADTAEPADADTDSADTDSADTAGVATVYGDGAYGSGEFQQFLEDNGIESRCRSLAPTAPGGRFSKDRFSIDPDGTVTCPAGVSVAIRIGRDGSGTARFGDACTNCELRSQCTDAAAGRTIRTGVHEAALARARQRQKSPAWQHDYRAVRPKVERKLAHLMRRKHGGRNARVRGRPKVGADFNLLAAAANVARLGALGVRSTPTGWAAA